MERPFHTPRRHVGATKENDEHCDAIAFQAVCLRLYVNIEKSVPSLKCFIHFRLFQLDLWRVSFSVLHIISTMSQPSLFDLNLETILCRWCIT